MKDMILLTSNCYGEDRSAALIATELTSLFEERGISRHIIAASLASEGSDYRSRGINLIHSYHVPPSGGFPTRSLKGFFLDLFHLQGIFKFINQIKKYGSRIDLCLAVGDVPLLFLTRSALKNCPLVFLAPAKSDYIESHYAVEEWYIRKNADYILTHDDFTACNMKKKGMKALFLGNPMMDNLYVSRTLDLAEGRPVIGILPGSRSESYDNLILILKLVEIVSSMRELTFVAAVPSALEINVILHKAALAGWTGKELIRNLSLMKKGVEVKLYSDSFPEILSASDVIIGLAGTANEQAAGMGKPIIGFRGCGPQTTPKRMMEQEKLLGGALKVIKKFPHDAVRELIFLLDNPGEREKRGEAGRQHMGAPGGARRIAEFIINTYYSVKS